MKIVVVGGSGLIGSKLLPILRGHGHEAVSASPKSGVDTITGEGLAEVLRGTAVVVDVTNAPSWEDAAVLRFFETSTRNLLAAESKAAVKHHVALSVVGTERLTQSGYFRAKLAQEKLIQESAVPYSIVRATQFFEFVGGIADFSTDGDKIRLPPALIQPMSSEDVAKALGVVAEAPSCNGIVEVGGPESFRMDELIRRHLRAISDGREVIVDPKAKYYGADLDERTLVPGGEARLGETRFDDWLRRNTGLAASK